MRVLAHAGRRAVSLSLVASLAGAWRPAASAVSGAFPQPRFIVDTDCGFDDLLALLCLAREGNLALVTTTRGVTESAAHGATVARALLDRVGCVDVPVIAGGCSGEAERPPPRWLRVSRENMRSFVAHELGAAVGDGGHEGGDEHAMLRAVRSCLEREADGSVELLALGPLTNVAAMSRDDELAAEARRALRGVTIMGGNRLADVRGGTGEFNFASDVQATRDVIASRALTGERAVRVVGLDVCHDGDELHAERARRVADRTGLAGALVRADAFSCVADPLAAFCAFTDGKGFAWARAHCCVSPAGVLAEVDADTITGAPPLLLVATECTARDAYFKWLGGQGS